MAQKYVEFSTENNKLIITLSSEKVFEEELRAIAAKEIDADSKLAEVMEWQLGNGWELVPPEEVGSLTSAPILSEDVERDSQGNVTSVGKIYWYPQYERFDPVEQLLKEGSITFVRGDDNEQQR